MNHLHTTQDYKRKLEHQMYLAQEHPARFYDLSYCQLSQVPKGVFSYCKVLRKYSLNLSHNKLSDLNSGGCLDDLQLIGSLVLSNNCIKSLTNDFGKLTNLKKLYLNSNKIQTFPMILSQLPNLTLLNLQDNRISKVTNQINRFEGLEELNLLDNPLVILSEEICTLKSLKSFNANTGNLKNVDDDIQKKGIVEVWYFLCNVKKIPPTTINTEMSPLPNTLPHNIIIDKFWCTTEYSKLSAELDEEIANHDLQLNQSDRHNFQKYVDSMKKKSHQEDEAIKAILSQKYERDNLFDQLNYMNMSSTELIDQIQRINNHAHKIEELKKKVRANENYLSVCYNVPADLSTSDKNDILESIKKLLVKHADNESKYSNNVSLAYDSQLQKQAYHLLMLDQDAQLCRLNEGIMLIEKKLVQLTQLEYSHQYSHDMAIQRTRLVDMLHNLKSEADSCKSDIATVLERLEWERSSMSSTDNQFWVKQFYKLSNSTAVNKLELEELLKLGGHERWAETLHYYGVNVDFLPDLTEKDLIEMNIEPVEVRKSLLKFLLDWRFNPMKKSSVSSQNPSAPELSMEINGKTLNGATMASSPSAPPMGDSRSDTTNTPNPPPSILTAHRERECCICLSSDADILHLNCGHVCCCKNCSVTVSVCPLCRQTIAQRVVLQFN